MIIPLGIAGAVGAGLAALSFARHLGSQQLLSLDQRQGRAQTYNEVLAWIDSVRAVIEHPLLNDEAKADLLSEVAEQSRMICRRLAIFGSRRVRVLFEHLVKSVDQLKDESHIRSSYHDQIVVLARAMADEVDRTKPSPRRDRCG